MTVDQDRRLDFWLDLASPYSYLSALRIDGLAQSAKVVVTWRPFLLGPIFKAQGLPTSPFAIYPAKGRYMIRDLERLSRARDQVFHMPHPFPQASLLATRCAHALQRQSERQAFVKAVLTAQFAHRQDIAAEATLCAVATALGFDFAQLFSTALSAASRDSLRHETALAMTLGIFGAPTFITADGELFWGDDRLEPALLWPCHA